MNQEKSTFFISDLHLCASRPKITETFLTFLKDIQEKAESLYILGDLFEYWAGDDDLNEAFNQRIINAFRALAQSGVAIFFMHGNRDFLIGETFCNAAHIHLLADPTLITLCGHRILLSHGDALCTDDVAYQAFRNQVRAPEWQAQFLDQPLETRKKQIEAIRARSEEEKTTKNFAIMDVNEQAVIDLLRQYQPDLFIHGHTHRPNVHEINLDGKLIKRVVLGDWYEQGSCLMLDTHGIQNLKL